MYEHDKKVIRGVHCAVSNGAPIDVSLQVISSVRSGTERRRGHFCIACNKSNCSKAQKH